MTALPPPIAQYFPAAPQQAVRDAQSLKQRHLAAPAVRLVKGRLYLHEINKTDCSSSCCSGKRFLPQMQSPSVLNHPVLSCYLLNNFTGAVLLLTQCFLSLSRDLSPSSFFSSPFKLRPTVRTFFLNIGCPWSHWFGTIGSGCGLINKVLDNDWWIWRGASLTVVADEKDEVY